MISAQMVKDLREKTGAGMMDCKKVLTEADGDMEKAIELLREKGIAKAAKKSDRIAAEGLVLAYVTEDRKGNGLVLSNSIKINTTLANLDSIQAKRHFDGNQRSDVGKDNPRHQAKHRRNNSKRRRKDGKGV